MTTRSVAGYAISFLYTAGLVLAAGVMAPSANAEELSTCKATYVKGLARLKPKGNPDYERLELGRTVSEGDEVLTLEDTRVELTFDTGQVVRLGSVNRCLVKTARKDDSGVLKCMIRSSSGRIWLKLRRMMVGSDFSIETGTLVVGVKGTVFRADIEKDGTTKVYVYDGTVFARNAGGQEIMAGRLERVYAPPSAGMERSVFDEAVDESDEWVRWNKDRDKLRIMVVISEKHGHEPASVSVAETAIIEALLKNYLFRVIDKEQADRIRAEDRIKAALRGDNAAAAVAGLELAADVVIVGEAMAEAYQLPDMGNPYSGRAHLVARLVRTDTAQVMAAYSPRRPARIAASTGDGAMRRALAIAGERAASVFVASVTAEWKKERREGAGIEVLVYGATRDIQDRVMKGIRRLPGVSDVESQYLTGGRALLLVRYEGGSLGLADGIGGTAFVDPRVEVVGLTAYRVEVDASRR